MSAEARFAAALAEVLGPLYSVSLVTPDGSAASRHGAVDLDKPRRFEIPLPSSELTLVLEVDKAALEGAVRVVALDDLIAAGEAEIGRPLAAMTRADKQHLVRFLDERGTFALKKAVDAVADALGVSRFTVYNYLDASRRD